MFIFFRKKTNRKKCATINTVGGRSEGQLLKTFLGKCLLLWLCMRFVVLDIRPAGFRPAGGGESGRVNIV